MKKVILIVIFFTTALISNAQVSKILGEWRTVDDNTGETKGVVEFYKNEDNGLYYGRLTHVYYKGEELNDPQYIGMIIIKDFREEDGMLKGGTLYEPDSGKTYYGKISYNAKDNTLILRGSIDKRGWIGRSQTWVK